MYIDFLLQAREASDIISRGEYKDPRTEEPTGIITRPVEAPADLSVSPYEDMILRYMGNVRHSTPAAIPRQSILTEDSTSVPMDDEAKALDALSMVETGFLRKGEDHSAQYSARGPLVKKGSYKGQRAIGKYQVMPGNVSQWTEEALGFKMTPEEFLDSPKAQDAVALHQMRKSKEKYGSWEEGASVWFSGRPIKKAGNASDGYSTVPEYISRFRKYYSGE